MKSFFIISILLNLLLIFLWLDSRVDCNDVRLDKIETEHQLYLNQVSFRLQLDQLINTLANSAKKIIELEQEIKQLKGPII